MFVGESVMLLYGILRVRGNNSVKRMWNSHMLSSHSYDTIDKKP